MKWWVAVAALWVCGPWLIYWNQRRTAAKQKAEWEALSASEKRKQIGRALDCCMPLDQVQQRAKQDAAERLGARIGEWRPSVSDNVAHWPSSDGSGER